MSRSRTEYIPQPIQATTPEGLAQYIGIELQRISEMAGLLSENIYIELHNEPARPQNGQVAYADGTDWDPGSGRGLYVYLVNQWYFIGIYSADGYWDDYISDLLESRPGLTNPPTAKIFIGNIIAMAFNDTTVEDTFATFHINHDYKKGTKIYPHVHWSPGNSTNVGTVRWGLEYTVAKGHQQQVFPTPTTVYIEQAADGTAYKHYIGETSDVDAIPATNLEPDTVIIVRVFRDASHVNDTFVGDAFGIMCDLHYQKDRTGTINKAPDFYA